MKLETPLPPVEAKTKYEDLAPAEGEFQGFMRLNDSGQDFAVTLEIKRVFETVHPSQAKDPAETISVPKLSGNLRFAALEKTDIDEAHFFSEILNPMGGMQTILFDVGDYDPDQKYLTLPYAVAGYTQGLFGELNGTLDHDRYSGYWFSKPFGTAGTFAFTRYSLAAREAAPAAVDRGTVFFERASLHEGYPERLSGLNFLPMDSASTVAFGIHFPVKRLFDGHSVHSPRNGGVIYSSPNNMGHSALVSTDMATLTTHTLKVLPKLPVSFSASADGDVLAWVDPQGTASVYQVTHDRVIALDLRGGYATRIHVSRSGGELVVSTGKNAHEDPKAATTLLFSLEDPTPSFEVIASPRTEISTDGRRVVWTEQSASGPVTLKTRDRKGGAVKAFPTEASGVYDMSWVDENHILYWADLPSELQEVRLTDVVTGVTETIAAINVPAQLTDSVVCPVMTGNAVFFANYSGSEFSIYKATRKGKTWEAQLFATTSHRTDGYICPRVSQGSN